MMGIEPTHKVPQTFALPLGHIQHIITKKPPNFRVRGFLNTIIKFTFYLMLKSNSISKYTTSSHAPVDTSLIKLLY